MRLPSTLPAIATAAALLVALVVASRISTGLFVAAGAALLATLAYLAYRHPRVMLVIVVFAPIVDRYLVSLVIPSSAHGLTNYLSEALLLLVAATIGVRAWRDGTLLPALRHPVVGLVAAFVAVGAVSAVVNGVPPLVALAGIGFTVEAVALFVLPRMVSFAIPQARLAFLALTGLSLVAALLALGQVLLHADFLGLQSFSGRFEEGRRVAAFLVNPNMLGVILAIGIPVPLLAAVRSDTIRLRAAWGAVTLVVALALLYTFSRGAWLGLGVAGLAMSVVDRRALLALVAVGALAYAGASVLPRHVLEPDGGDVGFDLGMATLGRFGSIAEGTDLRLQFVRNATPIIADHPILGAGPGRYGGAVAWRLGTPLSETYTDGAVPRNRTVDNFWLHLIAESGFAGAGLLLAALGMAIWQLLAAARRIAGWASILAAGAAGIGIIVGVDSLTEMLLEGNTTSFATWFFLGLASAVVAGGAVSPDPSRGPSVGPGSDG